MATVDTFNNNNNNAETVTTPHVEVGKWTLVLANGLPPSPRNGPTMVVAQNSLFTFGGYDQKAYSGRMHMYAEKNSSWIPLNEGPIVRTLHSAINYNNSMIVFGGTGTQTTRSWPLGGTTVSQLVFNDTWEYNYGTQEWSKMETTGTVPVPRDGHTAVLHDNQMYIFGGSDDSTIFFDLVALNLERKFWIRPRVTGTNPSPRRLHTCVVWDDSLWIFGGYDGKNCFNDIFKFDIASGNWTVVSTTGDPPHPRYGHSAVVYNNAMYIFGGYGAGAGYRKDLVRFDFETQNWTLLSAQNEVPARRRHAAVVLNDKMYVFGGAGGSSLYLNDMWVYEFAKESEVPEIASTLVEDLQNMLDNPNFYPDVVFKVGNKTIRAHKCILSARCSYFDSLFKSGLKEALANEIVIEDIEQEDVFVALLKYLYGGPVSVITPEVSLELLTISDRYLLPHLKWICENVVLEGISIENVSSLLATADTYKCGRLKKACFSFISQHHQHVVKTDDFKTLPQHLLLEVMTIVSSASRK